jgi:hypothetical protein
MYYTEVPDYILVARYCTMMVLCTIVYNYIVSSLEIVLHYTVVVLHTIVSNYTVVDVHYYTAAVVHYYTMVAAQVVLLHFQPAPCMYLQSFLSSSPIFYNPCLCVQLNYKSYTMYSLVFSDISALGGNDRDHAHVF